MKFYKWYWCKYKMIISRDLYELLSIFKIYKLFFVHFSKLLKHFIPAITFLFFLNSCSQKVSRSEYLIFYTTIIHLTDQASDETVNFIFSSVKIHRSLLNHVIAPNTKDSDEISIIKLDSLNQLNGHLINRFNTLISKISSLTELDKQINLKSIAIAALSKTKEFFEEQNKSDIKTYSKWKETSGKQDLHSLKIELLKKQLDEATLKFSLALKRFEEKYDITKEDLKKYGL